MLREHLKAKNQGEYGFTLIELLVVIIIIGILAAIAIPAFLNQKRKAELAEGKSDLRNVATIFDQRLSTLTSPTTLTSFQAQEAFRVSLTEANVRSDYSGTNRKKTMAFCLNDQELVLVFWTDWSTTTPENGQTYEFLSYSNQTGLTNHSNTRVPRAPGSTLFLGDLCTFVLPDYKFAQWAH